MKPYFQADFEDTEPTEKLQQLLQLLSAAHRSEEGEISVLLLLGSAVGGLLVCVQGSLG